MHFSTVLAFAVSAMAVVSAAALPRADVEITIVSINEPCSKFLRLSFPLAAFRALN
jgi:hypothetical protein